jgi:hypothetical protein
MALRYDNPGKSAALIVATFSTIDVAVSVHGQRSRALMVGIP